jgi:hypothetical protein
MMLSDAVGYREMTNFFRGNNRGAEKTGSEGLGNAFGILLKTGLSTMSGQNCLTARRNKYCDLYNNKHTGL